MSVDDEVTRMRATAGRIVRWSSAPGASSPPPLAAWNDLVSLANEFLAVDWCLRKGYDLPACWGAREGRTPELPCSQCGPGHLGDDGLCTRHGKRVLQKETELGPEALVEKLRAKGYWK